MLSAVQWLSTNDAAPSVVIHSGDVTQAGQLGSLKPALEAIRRAAPQARLHAIPGNHDVWPEDFPSFAADRTSLQLQRIRQSGELPRTFADHHNPGGLLDWVLLDSTAPDALLNTSALGSVDVELGPAFSWQRQLTPPPTRAGKLLAAVMHHPPEDLHGNGTSWWRIVQRQMQASVGMLLLNAPAVRSELISHNVSIVLCGHDHQPPTDPAAALVEGGRLLVLQAGCPTLDRGFGNNDDPQFSLYDVVEKGGDEIDLYWATNRFTTRGWAPAAHYRFNGHVWRVIQTQFQLPGQLSRWRPRPPLLSRAIP
jgi:3',5'-cyclic AMP phosphodiesterase CpdA